MKRITLTAAAARLIEQQISAYEDQRDEKGKPLREPKERRQWDRIADLFTDAAGDYDVTIERLQKDGMAFGSTVMTEQAKTVESLLAAWQKDEPDAERVTAAASALKDLFGMRISAKERELTDAMTLAEDTLGTASGEVDLDDTQVDFLKTAFDALDLPTTRRTRRLVNQITDALKDAVELVKDGDRYVPRARLSVVDSEKSG